LPPDQEYRGRLGRWREAHARDERWYRNLGNARLAVGIAAVLLAALALGAGWISAWWLLLPLGVFVALAVVHDRVARTRATAERGIAYWERATARLGDQWIGKGDQGERFRNSSHIYADDLDIFGRGSLFELLSTCRTAAGETALASWILAPAEREEAVARQQAIEELRRRLDLREELAIMGEEVRAAVDAKALTEWGGRPPVRFFSGARVIAFALGCAALAAFALYLAHVLDIRAFLAVILAEIGCNLAVREAVQRVVGAVSLPARELRLLTLLLERLEREPFSSPRLIALRRKFEHDGQTASRQVRRLGRLMEYLDSARNQFFRPFAAVLMWIPQFAMAVESWRAANGPRIGDWVAAIGEFEALCSLAGFAYEHPDASFPELTAQTTPILEARELRHPLLPGNASVPNDVRLGQDAQLWIVSGSNMSGKSTLLRAIGLNAVLAWAGAPVACQSLCVSRLYIGASMRANDSLADHRSRFYAEIERLRDIVDLPRAGRPTLFLLDELLSGTNSHDRRIGAQALLRGLVERGAIGLATTHDLALAEIAETLDGRASNVHFEDHLEGGEMRFDYRLRPGVVTHSNALALMRAVGLDV
jgi:MutS-like protein